MWDPAGILSSCRQYARPGRVNRDAAGQIAGMDIADRSQAWTPHARTSHGLPPGYSKTGASALRAGTCPRTSGHPSFHSIRSSSR